MFVCFSQLRQLFRLIHRPMLRLSSPLSDRLSSRLMPHTQLMSQKYQSPLLRLQRRCHHWVGSPPFPISYEDVQRINNVSDRSLWDSINRSLSQTAEDHRSNLSIVLLYLDWNYKSIVSTHTSYQDVHFFISASGFAIFFTWSLA